MKKRAEPVAVYALAFLIPTLAMLWTYAGLGFAPWGDKSILVSDMSSQYVDFFCALKNGDLFFSWSKALGTGYIGVISYYVSSPLSLLTLLCPNEQMPLGLMLLTVLKIGLAGLSFAVFARRRFPGCGWAAALGAVCYALMAYNAAYALCIMWLDGVVWLPLILLALERILAGRSAGPFIAALTVCFISTWYISYMIGIFCCLYLAARLIVLQREKKALGCLVGRFFGGAACALALTAWLWLPTFLAMFSGKFIGGNVDYDGFLACEPMDLLDHLRAGQFSSLYNTAPPYVFCGTLMLALAAAWFFLRQFPLWEKLANGAVMSILTASMLLSPLDKAWHLFQRPNWFPCRYSFIVSFFIIYLAVQALAELRSTLSAGRAWTKWTVRAAALTLSLLTVAELSWNSKSILAALDEQYTYGSYGEYHDYYIANAALVCAAQEDGGGTFFRMRADNFWKGTGSSVRRYNSPLAYGYAGITHYSSLYNANVNHLLKELGLVQSWYWCAGFGSTPVTDAFLDVEYVVSREVVPGYVPLVQENEYTLWKNPEVLPLAVLARGTALELEGETVFERQNSLLNGLLGRRAEPFTPMPAALTAGDGWAELAFTGTGLPIYADLSDMELQDVWVNGVRILELGSGETACVHCLGVPSAGEAWTVTLRSRPGTTPDGGNLLWEYHEDVLSAAVEVLDKAEILSVEKNGRVRLAAQTNAPRTLVTTVPAEDGWTAYVDGERTDTGTYLDTFLSLELDAGEHTVELRYTAPGLIPGLALGGAAVLGLIAAELWKRRRKGR